jgi:hypothetical protein
MATPISAMELSPSQLVDRQSVAMVIATRELLERGDTAAFNLLANELHKAVAKETDRSFTQGILDDTNVQSASSAALSADIEAAVLALETGANARVYVVAPPFVIKALSQLRGTGGGRMYPGVSVNGGSKGGVTYVGTDTLSNDVIVLEAARCAANSDALNIESSRNADVQLSDTPTDGAANLTSLFQSNRRAVSGDLFCLTPVRRRL